MSEEHYRMIFEYDKEEGVYFVRFPELPGCLAHGKTLQEALESAAKTRDQWLEANRIAWWDVPVAAQAKPLTWKTGPVPKDFEGLILCEMKADESPYFVVAMATGEIVHCIFPSHKNDVLRWLPLSEILALIANQTGTDRQSDGGE